VPEFGEIVWAKDGFCSRGIGIEAAASFTEPYSLTRRRLQVVVLGLKVERPLLIAEMGFHGEDMDAA
jgi:hypothetical protein